MNKKELAEIKKQFGADNYRFTINRIANAYVLSGQGVSDTRFFQVRNFALIPEAECDIYIENCKKTLGGQLGKGLVEYPFPAKAYEEDGGQYRLYKLLKSGLEDEELVRDYIAYIVESTNYTASYYITIAHCTYSVPSKDKNDEEDPEFDDGETYDFLLTSINFAALTDIGLYFNEKEQIVEKKLNTDMQILRAPSEGFLFPTYSDRTADVNSVLYFTKTPKAPNQDIISTVLGCEFTLSAEEEKIKFARVLSTALDNDLDYETVSNIHENIREVIRNTEAETEMPTLNKKEIMKILKNSGVSDENLEKFDSVYDQELEGMSLKPVNMMDMSKLDIKIPDVVVNIKPAGAQRVKTETVKGRKYLLIPIDDTLEVNGFAVNP